MRAVVVALGKIGLPVAVKIALAGHHVVGCDVDPRVVDLVNSGVEPFPGEAHLAELLGEVVGAGRLQATTDTAAAVSDRPDLVVAVPPLMVDDKARPDFRILDDVVDQVGRGLQEGTVVSVETTLPVWTTRNRIAPALAQRSGLRSEEEFVTVHSPERVYSGRVFADLDSYPKLVGGLSGGGERRAVELYSSFLTAPVWSMGGAEAAELTKLAETTYRDVNIALANEFALFAERSGIDLQAVIEAANSQPFSHIHQPGVAVGGHCIPVYPRFYLEGDPGAVLPRAARKINTQMPVHALELLSDALGGDLSGERVLILGVTYRGGVKETAFSGAFALRDELLRRGAMPLASDPMYEDDELRRLGFEPYDDGTVAGAVVQADHAEYATLRPEDVPGIRGLVDGRGVVQACAWVGSATVRRIGQSHEAGCDWRGKRG